VLSASVGGIHADNSTTPNQPSDCTGEAVYTETVGPTNGSASTTDGAHPNTLDNPNFDGTCSYLPRNTNKTALRTTALNLASTLDQYTNGDLCWYSPIRKESTEHQLEI